MFDAYSPPLLTGTLVSGTLVSGSGTGNAAGWGAKQSFQDQVRALQPKEQAQAQLGFFKMEIPEEQNNLLLLLEDV